MDSRVTLVRKSFSKYLLKLYLRFVREPNKANVWSRSFMLVSAGHRQTSRQEIGKVYRVEICAECRRLERRKRSGGWGDSDTQIHLGVGVGSYCLGFSRFGRE